jgi:hypothetical protein
MSTKKKTLLEALAENPLPQEPEPEKPSFLGKLFGKPESKPETPHDALLRFQRELSVLIRLALDARVDRRSIADALEDAATQQRGAWSLTAPL